MTVGNVLNLVQNLQFYAKWMDATYLSFPVGKQGARSYIFIETCFPSKTYSLPVKDANPFIDRTKFFKA